jgi:hypothetical protein
MDFTNHLYTRAGYLYHIKGCDAQHVLVMKSGGDMRGAVEQLIDRATWEQQVAEGVYTLEKVGEYNFDAIPMESRKAKWMRDNN